MSGLPADFFANNWILVLVNCLLAVFALCFLGYVILSRIERRLVRSGMWPSQLSLAKKFVFSISLLATSLVLGTLPSLLDMPDRASEYVLTVSKLGGIFSTMLILLKVVNLSISIYSQRLKIDRPDNLRERRLKTQIQYLEKILDLAIIFVALIAIALSFESLRRFGGSLLASAGLASVILGFSAQRSLGNLIAGFQIAFTQPIRLGDVVLVENEWGEIEEITLTYVVVRLWDLRRLVLPITYFLEKPFQNWTRTSSELIGTVFLYLDYATPIEELRAELKRVLEASPLWDKRVMSLQVTDSTERTMTVRALVSARNSGMTFDLRCEVREALLRFLQDRYPQALPKTQMVLKR